MKNKYFNVLKLLTLFPAFIGAQITLPYTENFGGSTTQSQWDFSNPAPIVVENTSVDSPNGGTGGSLMYNFYNSVGNSIYNVVSPLLANATNAPVGVTFEFAAANRYTMPVALQTVFADDHLFLEYSTDGGTTFYIAKDYEIGVTGELNTGGITSSIFTPTSTQWVKKNFMLPAGTNRVNFKGVKNNINQAGNMAYLDHVVFQVCNENVAAPTGDAIQSFCSPQTLGDLHVSGSEIKWYSVSTGGAQLPATTPLVNGTTYYAAQLVGACESTTRLAVTANAGGCLAVDEIKATDEIGFYPNPAKNFLHIKAKGKLGKIEIYNGVGQLVLNMDNAEEKINISSLSKGIYFLKYTLKGDVQKTYKLIKE